MTIPASAYSAGIAIPAYDCHGLRGFGQGDVHGVLPSHEFGTGAVAIEGQCEALDAPLRHVECATMDGGSVVLAMLQARASEGAAVKKDVKGRALLSHG